MNMKTGLTLNAAEAGVSRACTRQTSQTQKHARAKNDMTKFCENASRRAVVASMKKIGKMLMTKTPCTLVRIMGTHAPAPWLESRATIQDPAPASLLAQAVGQRNAGACCQASHAVPPTSKPGKPAPATGSGHGGLVTSKLGRQRLVRDSWTLQCSERVVNGGNDERRACSILQLNARRREGGAAARAALV